MMKLPILDVIEADDFKNALKQLNHCDVILIDTTGSSQYDKEKLARLETFLKRSDAEIDVNLVLSAGSKVEDLLEVYNSFSFLVYETGKPVSFLCLGQEVPDDIMAARSEFLVDCVLQGFNKDKK